jgi:hypothetical protein
VRRSYKCARAARGSSIGATSATSEDERATHGRKKNGPAHSASPNADWYKGGKHQLAEALLSMRRVRVYIRERCAVKIREPFGMLTNWKFSTLGRSEQYMRRVAFPILTENAEHASLRTGSTDRK